MDMQASSNQELNGVGNDNNWGMRYLMFEKVLTPSDVGKLNRLVIPKLHAENYFPLEDNQNGTTLDFLDRDGKAWRFRYSYWNSSQSYVMTKGWSRFIKDKLLKESDTVSFHRTDVPDDSQPGKSRKVMFIDWRHNRTNAHHGNPHHYPIFGSPASPMLHPMGCYYPWMDCYRGFPPLYGSQYQERELFGCGYVNGGRYVRNPTSEMRRAPLDHHLGRSQPLVFDSFPVFPAARMTPLVPPQPKEGLATTKRKLRLFGVDMEESSSSGKAKGYSLSSPVVIKDDIDQSSWRPPHGEIGVSSSSVMQLSDEEEHKRKGKGSL